MGKWLPSSVALSKKVMLVCSDTPNQVERYLYDAGHEITKISDGATALNLARRNHFDLVILVSTGKTMDLTETALNLRDLSPSSDIIILAGASDSDQAPLTKGRVGKIIPRARVLKPSEVESFFKTRMGGGGSIR